MSKSIIFPEKSFLDNFYRHLATFYWSHCTYCSFGVKLRQRESIREKASWSCWYVLFTWSVLGKDIPSQLFKNLSFWNLIWLEGHLSSLDPSVPNHPVVLGSNQVTFFSGHTATRLWRNIIHKIIFWHNSSSSIGHSMRWVQCDQKKIAKCL